MRRELLGNDIEQLLPNLWWSFEMGYPALCVQIYGQKSYTDDLYHTEWTCTREPLRLELGPVCSMALQRIGAKVRFEMEGVCLECSASCMRLLVKRIAALDGPELLAPQRAALEQFLCGAQLLL